MAESRGLGRGLEALLGSRLRPLAVNAPGVASLPLTSIRPGDAQPRRSMQQEPLEELAASIRANGIIQPIVVRPIAGGEAERPVFEIVAGERRWQAAKLVGLTDIPVVIRDLTDQEAVAIALIENIQREDLTPTEEARALQRLAADFSLTHEQVASAVGRSRAAVSNLIRLLELPPSVVALVDSMALGMGHARALLGLESLAERTRLAELAVKHGWSVRDVEGHVRRAMTGESAVQTRTSVVPLVTEVIRDPTTRVWLHQKLDGSGKLVVEFSDAQTRDGLVAAIRGWLDV